MKCWICGDSADTGEHLIKASDMRTIFGHIRQNRPVFMHSAFRRNVLVKGINVDLLKSGARICQRCNNERTQPYDQAWQILSAYLRSTSHLKVGNRINLSNIFPGVVHKSMLHVHLYFVKRFGCLIAENLIPIDVGSLSSSILNRMAHPRIFLAVSQHTNGNTSGLAGYSDLGAARLDDRVVFAVWHYILDRFSVRIIYAEPTEHRKGLIDSWHPSTITKCLKFSKY